MFTEDGKQLAVAGADKRVTLLDGVSAKLVRQLPRQADPIVWLAALRKGSTIVTGSAKEESMAIPGDTLAFDADGTAPRVLVSGRLFNGGGVGNDGRLRLTTFDAGSIVVWAVR